MADKFDKKEITKKSDNISQWYLDVVQKAELADYGPAKGTIVFRPYGYAVWEKVQEVFNEMIKSDGVENGYFPLFIPYHLLEKEKTHVKGFSPELAVVTHGGGEKLVEPLVVRPTSETIMYHMYAKWIHSHRDLPVKINQWNNVVRWEKRTYPFLRTSEFLWQEGHTAHASEKGAMEMQEKALGWYQQIYEEYFAMPVVVGVKSKSETFAGADTTYTIEALMPDGKALQAATSHNLGQNFAKAFEIDFQDKDGKSQFVWQTSWGLSTRALGGLFLAHGDDQGLVLPPKIAPIQVVIVPIYRDQDKDEVLGYAKKLEKQLDGKVRVKLDDRDELSPGNKFNHWELKGVPLRIEVGPKEVSKEEVTVAKRVGGQGKETIPFSIERIEEILDEIQVGLKKRLETHLSENTSRVDSYSEFKEVMKKKRGFIIAFWCEGGACEAKIKEETRATTRALPFDAKKEKGKCVRCGKLAEHKWYFSQAY